VNSLVGPTVDGMWSTLRAFPIVLHHTLSLIPNSKKQPVREHICALVSAAHPEEVEGHKKNFVYV
jgi:hypothetical protein